jgi:tRNA-specific 2-thiouridylase
MFAEYEKGRTPNPDVLCNREIKFDVFLEEALKLGADYVATGHYCRKETVDVDGKPTYKLLAGSDPNKDQSYFLCQLSQKQLEKAMFPIGDVCKPEVRRIANELNLVTAHKKDSQGICFVGKVDLPVFLQQKLAAKEGKVFIIEPECEIFSRDWSPADNADCPEETLYALSKGYEFHPKWGRKVGLHQGAHYYTIGQRKGLNIGGFPEPLFIIGTNVDYNQIYVGMGERHPGLYRKVLRVNRDELHWVRPDKALNVGESLSCGCRIRYRQPLQKARAVMGNDALYIIFDEAQRGVTAGQFAVIYIDEEVIFSGVIAE